MSDSMENPPPYEPVPGESPATEVTTPAPVISDHTTTLWQVVNTETDGIAFTSERRQDAEAWMHRLSRGRPVVLQRVERRVRSETWWGTPTTVPWHSPCGWVSAIGDPQESAWCVRHDHRWGEPVPASAWLPPLDSASASSAQDGER
jgi:hypothetical protein